MKDLKVFANVIEDEALNQVHLLMEQVSFQDQKVRIMPDVHAGKGSVIGFTSTMGDYIIPNVVGVDIGCGMRTIQLGQYHVPLDQLDEIIRKFIPHGRNTHEGRIAKFDRMMELRCFRELKDTKRLERSIGTLGGGNHFIELDKDEVGNLYLVIHSGSRNLGHQVASYYQTLAFDLLCGKDKLIEEQNKLIAEYKAAGRKAEIEGAIKALYKNFRSSGTNVPKDLAYLTGEWKDNYLHDMGICQEYATLNRKVMGDLILKQLGIEFSGYEEAFTSFDTIHNYIDLNEMIIRKGAISAKEGERLLIPLNMRDGCILGVGKGNPDWNQSAPHGAGRIMSRIQAKATFKMEDYVETMKGIYTTSVCEKTLDEVPMAYKNMKDILDVIGPTVEIVSIIKPVYNFKASE